MELRPKVGRELGGKDGPAYPPLAHKHRGFMVQLIIPFPIRLSTKAARWIPEWPAFVTPEAPGFVNGEQQPHADTATHSRKHRWSSVLHPAIVDPKAQKQRARSGRGAWWKLCVNVAFRARGAARRNMDARTDNTPLQGPTRVDNTLLRPPRRTKKDGREDRQGQTRTNKDRQHADQARARASTDKDWRGPRPTRNDVLRHCAAAAVRSQHIGR